LTAAKIEAPEINPMFLKLTSMAAGNAILLKKESHV